MGGGWLPTPMQSSIVNFASGASMPFVNGFISPYTDGILSPLGSYKDEARTAIVGIAAYKLGSGIIKQAGKAYFDYAVTSAGVQTGMNFTGTNNTGGSGFSTGNSQGAFSW